MLCEARVDLFVRVWVHLGYVHQSEQVEASGSLRLYAWLFNRVMDCLNEQ